MWSTGCCASSGGSRLTDERREELDEDLPEIGRHTSEMERRANEAERELVQWKKVRFMADKVGDIFHGYITGVAPFGLFVELSEHYVEGLVHVSTMADDYYRYNEQNHTLFGENTRKSYRLGDKVAVQVVRVDLERRQIDLGTRRGSRRRSRRRAAARAGAQPRPAEKGRSAKERPRSGARPRPPRSGRKQRPGKKRAVARKRRQ